jgi:hypothetical protein
MPLRWSSRRVLPFQNQVPRVFVNLDRLECIPTGFLHARGGISSVASQGCRDWRVYARCKGSGRPARVYGGYH